MWRPPGSLTKGSAHIGVEIQHKVGPPASPESGNIRTWIKALEEDPNELRYAARDAGKISDNILQFDRHEERPAEEKPREAGLSSSVSRQQPEVSRHPQLQPRKEPVSMLDR